MTYLKHGWIILIPAAIFFSCRKDSFITSPQANVSASADTLFFDTVFTSAGSITQSFKIFNNNNQKLRLSEIKLSGGDSSAFKINIDGFASSEVNDIDINANDSIYVFVQVNINPTSAHLPFLVQDSILISYNGNQKYVQLQAYGQNANFLRSVIIKGNVSWNKTLPYVVLGGILIDSNATLSIPQGVRVYLHADAPFLVNGTLVVNGTRQDSVVFNSDRLDADYKDLPAGWPGIFFGSSSKNNYLDHAIIKNAYQGIIVQDPSVNANPKVRLSQCIINNVYDAGVLAVNSAIAADNCLISNCGSNIELLLGGNYSFVNCTVASYNNYYITHSNPVLQASDDATQNGVTQPPQPFMALFQNCIFWGDLGNVDNEIVLDKEGNSFTANFDHVIYKAKEAVANATFSSSLVNTDPLFDSIDAAHSYYDFHLKDNSPAIGAGVPTSFPLDLDDLPRADPPAMGCYEK
ncbi:MAG TPA: hypothetical protein VG847_12015 [Chitinophagaceae bacterium]|nr:hypothetical protein [Chitinophagaceae bacterium]